MVMYDSKSAMTFFQRTGRLATYVNPEPRIQPCTHLVHSIPLQPPLPQPAMMYMVREQNAPDRYASQEWPHGNVTEI